MVQSLALALGRLGNQPGGKVSASKIKAVVEAAMAMRDSQCEGVVRELERYFRDVDSAGRLGALYTVDAVLKKEHKVHALDVLARTFRPRLLEMATLLGNCSSKDMAKVSKVFATWARKGIFSSEEVRRWARAAHCEVPKNLPESRPPRPGVGASGSDFSGLSQMPSSDFADDDILSLPAPSSGTAVEVPTPRVETIRKGTTSRQPSSWEAILNAGNDDGGAQGGADSASGGASASQHELIRELLSKAERDVAAKRAAAPNDKNGDTATGAKQPGKAGSASGWGRFKKTTSSTSQQSGSVVQPTPPPPQQQGRTPLPTRPPPPPMGGRMQYELPSRDGRGGAFPDQSRPRQQHGDYNGPNTHAPSRRPPMAPQVHAQSPLQRNNPGSYPQPPVHQLYGGGGENGGPPASSGKKRSRWNQPPSESGAPNPPQPGASAATAAAVAAASAVTAAVRHRQRYHGGNPPPPPPPPPLPPQPPPPQRVDVGRMQQVQQYRHRDESAAPPGPDGRRFTPGPHPQHQPFPMRSGGDHPRGYARGGGPPPPPPPPGGASFPGHEHRPPPPGGSNGGFVGRQPPMIGGRNPSHGDREYPPHHGPNTMVGAFPPMHPGPQDSAWQQRESGAKRPRY